MNRICRRQGTTPAALLACVALSYYLVAPAQADVRLMGTPDQIAAYAAKWQGQYAVPLGQREPGFGTGNLPDTPLVGNFKAVCLLVRFVDADHDLAHDIPFYRNMFNNTANADSFHNYWLEQSLGQFNLTVDTYGWFSIGLADYFAGGPVPVKGDYLGFPMSGDPLEDMFAAAVTEADPTVDFSQYDADKDGRVDFLIVVHAGLNGVAPEVEAWNPGPFATSYSANNAVSSAFPANLPTNDGVVVDSVCQWHELWAQRSGVISHEFGHMMGLPDLYDTTFTATANWGPLGIWSLMGRGIFTEDASSPPGLGGFYVLGQGWPGVPSHLDPWSKIQLGWLRTNDGTLVDVQAGTQAVSIPPVELPGARVYRVYANGNAQSNEYFLVERRSQTGFDTPLPGEGLLIWHIDHQVIADWIAVNAPVNDLTHLGIAVEQADGLHDLEQVTVANVGPGITVPPSFTTNNLGDAGDLWPGSSNNKRFVPSTATTASSVPNSPTSDDYKGDSSGLSITDINNVSGATTATISLDVTYSPTVDIITPTANQQVVNFTPTIQVQFSETHPLPPGFDLNQIVLTIDGTEVVGPALGNVATNYNATTNTLTYTSAALVSGTHTIRAVGRDLRGNIARGQDVTGQPADYDELRFVVTPKAILAGVQMVSVPFALTHSTPSFVLSDPAPEIARYDTTINGYHFFTPTTSHPSADPTSPFVNSMVPGRSYWVRLSRDVALQLRGGDVAKTRQELTFERPNGDGTLPAGWYMVATPFDFTIDFSSLQVQYRGSTLSLAEAIEQDIVGPAIYTFENGAYSYAVAPNGALETFRGHWLRILKSGVRVYALPLPSGRADRAQAPPNLGEGGWLVQLSASTPSGRDEHNYFGVAANAADGRGRLDVEEPPPPAASVRGAQLSFIRSDWGPASGRFAQEVRRGPVTQPQAWDVLVEATGDEPTTLSWGDLSSVPHNVRLTLFDSETNRSLYMRTTRAYTFAQDAQTARRLQIIAEPDAGGFLRISNVSLQPSRSGGVNVAFSVTEAATSQVTIRSATGRAVRVLPATAHRAGLVTRQWDGRDATGRAAPKGAYTFEIVARTEENRAVRAVRPFLVTR